MFTEPITVTVDTTPLELPRVSVGNRQADYSLPDGSLSLRVAHSIGKRTRRTSRLDVNQIGSDPLVIDQQKRYSMSAYLVVDVPPYGFTQAEIKENVQGLTGLLADDDYLTRFLGGES